MTMSRFLLFSLSFVTMAVSGCSPLVPRGTRSRRASQRLTGLRSPVAVRWRKVLTKHVYGEQSPEEFAAAEVSPDGSTVWVGSSAGYMWALSSADGSVSWRRKMPGDVLSRPLYVASKGLLYVGLGDGCMYALDPSSGKERWKYCTKGVLYRRPTYHRGLLYFANERNRVFALDAATGTWQWSYDREMPSGFTVQGHSPVTVSGGRAYAGFADGVLVCLDAGSGDPIWTRDLTGGKTEYVDVDAEPVLVDGVLYAASYAGGVYALDPKMGALKWHFKVQAPSAVAVADDHVYFVSSTSGLHCLDLEGRLVYRQGLEAGGTTKPLVYEDMLVFSTSEKGVYFVVRETGAFLARLDMGYGVSAPLTISNGMLFFLENGGSFLAATFY